MSRRRGTSFVSPLHWSEQELDRDRKGAIAAFRVERMEEPLEEYLEHFENAQGTMEELIESTVDLAALGEQALTILSDSALLDGFRYLAAPPISMDDLKTLARHELASGD